MFFVDGLSIASDTIGQVRRIGHFRSLEDALAAAEQMINECLLREFQPGMLPETLFAQYKRWGEVPYIFRDDDEIALNRRSFDHFGYAFVRSTEICRSRRLEIH